MIDELRRLLGEATDVGPLSVSRTNPRLLLDPSCAVAEVLGSGDWSAAFAARLAALHNAAPTLASLLARLEAAEAVVEAVKTLRLELECNDVMLCGECPPCRFSDALAHYDAVRKVTR